MKLLAAVYSNFFAARTLSQMKNPHTKTAKPKTIRKAVLLRAILRPHEREVAPGYHALKAGGRIGRERANYQ